MKDPQSPLMQIQTYRDPAPEPEPVTVSADRYAHLRWCERLLQNFEHRIGDFYILPGAYCRPARLSINVDGQWWDMDLDDVTSLVDAVAIAMDMPVSPQALPPPGPVPEPHDPGLVTAILTSLGVTHLLAIGLAIGLGAVLWMNMADLTFIMKCYAE